MMDNVFTLYVTDHLDYYISYSRWLASGETIIASRWEIRTTPEPITITNEGFTTSLTRIMVLAVSIQPTCEVINQIETQQGRKHTVLLLFRINA